MLARKALAGTAAAPKIYVEDVFSTYLYTGNGTGNFIENGINLGNAKSSGSAYFDGTGDYLSIPSNSVFNLGTGDFTVECWVYRTGTGTGYETILGFDVTGGLLFELFGGELDYGIRATANNKSGVAVPSFQWVHLAISRQSGTVRYFQDGALTRTYTGTYATQDFTNNTAALVSSYSAGAGVFNGYISNLRLVKGTAVYTSAFTPSTSQLTAVSGTSLLLLQGNSPLVDNSGNALSVTAYGDAKAKSFGPFTGSTAGEGGMVWTKNRDTAGTNHILCDTGRGITNYINSNNANGQNANGSLTDVLTAVTNSGYLIGADATLSAVNVNAKTYTSWTFRKAKKFFDIVTFTTNGSEPPNTGDISHNLGSTPGCVMVKCTSGSQDWKVYHTGLSGGGFNAINRVLQLNDTSAASTSTNWINVSSTTISFPGSALDPSSDYVAYLFAHDAGGFGDAGSDSIIKCGSLTTDGSGDATVTLDWEPQWLLLKPSSDTGNWLMVDTMRGWNVNSSGNIQRLFSNLSNAESAGGQLNPTATGFKTSSGGLAASTTYIYIAIRRGPMKTPTSGTSVHKTISRAGTSANATVTGAGFPPDLIIAKETVNNIGYGNVWFNRPSSSNRFLRSQLTTGEATSDSTGLTSFDMDGFTVGNEATYAGIINGSGSTYINWLFRRAPGFMDIVCYTGNGSTTAISHNLGVTPELIIVKQRSTTRRWVVGSNFGSTTYTISWVNETTTPDKTATYTTSPNGNYGYGGAPTSTTFTVDTTSETNASGSTYVAYLFASVSGVSKVGSYTGNGSSQTINCNFTAGARFILIKRTDSTGDWYVFDTVQGIVSGNDPFLRWNSAGGQALSYDLIDPDNSGFIVNQESINNLNASSATYIYLAIA